MPTKSRSEIGAIAEERAAVWLQSRGFRVLSRNWRTRWCEVDVVARRHDTIHIVEVRYRSRQGWELAAQTIDRRKLRRLRLAAASWIWRHREYAGCGLQVDVVAVTPHTLVYLPAVGGP